MLQSCNCVRSACQLGLCLLASVAFSQARLFVSLSEAHRLVQLERRLVNAVSTHILHAEFELDAIKARFEELKNIRREVKTLRKGLTATDYSENPINAYAIVKRLVDEWPKTFKLMASLPSIQEAEIPDKSALLDEMVAGLVEYQEEKGIDTKILARGKLNGTRNHANLTAEDCWKIGRHYYNKQNVSMALHWLREARYKLEDQSVDPKKVFEYIFLSRCLNGDMEGSIAAYRSMLDKRGEWRSSMKELSIEYDREDIRRCKIAAVKVKATKKPTPVKKYNLSSEICRGKGLRKPKTDLVCLQLDFDNTYLKLQPNKVEQVYHSPLIIMFHDILRDQDILDIKETVVKQLKPLKMGVNGPVTLPNGIQKYLNRRISILKNFLEEQMILEGNQVAVISPGANYTTLIDTPNEKSEEENKKNKIDHKKSNENEKKDPKQQKGNLEVVGKIVYFLSDETHGGNTVFPSLRLTVTPRQGSALLWFNPKITGYAENDGTEIGECPVIMGTKWVMTNRILGENIDG